MEFLRLLLIVVHFIGLAMLIGPFIAQMRANSNWPFLISLIGAIIQVVTGIALIGVVTAQGGDLNHIKFGIKALIGVIVLIAAIIGYTKQKKMVAAGTDQRPIKVWFHVAGGLAIINVLIAVLWR